MSVVGSPNAVWFRQHQPAFDNKRFVRRNDDHRLSRLDDIEVVEFIFSLLVGLTILAEQKH
jgi:hypothetical protein